jgi:hypothetical protein
MRFKNIEHPGAQLKVCPRTYKISISYLGLSPSILAEKVFAVKISLKINTVSYYSSCRNTHANLLLIEAVTI